MENFEILEISAVDRPAQAGAVATIMKRYDKQEHDMFRKIEPRGFDSFEDAVAAIAKAERLPRHADMSQVAERYPSLLKDYRDTGEEIGKTIKEAMQPKPPSTAMWAFDQVVSDIAKRESLPRHRAMQAARERHPELHEAAFRQA